MPDKFLPLETPKQNYDQNVVNWSYVRMKYATPFGPEQKQYEPYYSYNVDVNLNGQWVNHKWYPSVDEHELIQLTGATKDTVIAVTHVKDGKRKGLVAMYSQGPQVSRTPEQVKAEIQTGLAELEKKKAPQAEAAGLPGTILPPAPPQFGPPGVQTAVAQGSTAAQPAGAPPTPPAPAPQQQAPPPPTTSVPPPQPRAKQPPQPPPSKPFENGDGPYQSRVEDGRVMEVLRAIGVDSVALRRMAWDLVEEAFADVLPVPPDYKKPNKTQQAEIAQVMEKRAVLILGLSAPINMTLEKQSYRVWKSGQRLATEEDKAPEPEPEPAKAKPSTDGMSAETREGALEMVNILDPENYNDPRTLITDWLKYTAEPHEHINSWKHAGNICNLLGLDQQVLIDDYDVNNLLTYTQAIWDYEDHRQQGEERNEILEYIAEQYGIAPEQMKFEVNEDEDE
jgi:hypothetical protein